MEKEIAESFNKSSEAIKHFEQLLKSPRSNNDTSRLGFTSTKEGESSKSAEERSDKGKNTKPLVISVVKRDRLVMCVGVRRLINRKNPRKRVAIINAISRDTRHKTARLGLLEHQDFMVTAITARSMVIELLSAVQSLCGHLTN